MAQSIDLFGMAAVIPIDHVLGRFRPAEKAVMDEAVETAAQAVLVWAAQGVEVCMNQYNG